MEKYSHLLRPMRLGSIELKNRVGMSALTRNRALDTYPTELMKEYYLQRVRGGAGLIVTEGILVVRQGTEWPNAPGLWDSKHVACWKSIVDAVHREGGSIYAQLWHVGRVAHPDAPEQILAGTPVYAPSAIPARGGRFRHLAGEPSYTTPTAIEDPWIIIDQFKQAALNAQAAGFDGVELHAANGYLVHQFLDSTSNQRTDQWGGSAENRSRFGLEILKVLDGIFGPNVSVKLSPAGGYNDVGMPLDETRQTYHYFISEADKLQLSYITLVRYVSRRDVEYDGKLRSTVHDVLEDYRPFILNSRVFLNAGVSPEEGEALVASGSIDGVFIGFGWITHPDLVRRLEQGIPLNNAPNFAGLQPQKGEDDWSVGYTDYPTISRL